MQLNTKHPLLLVLTLSFAFDRVWYRLRCMYLSTQLHLLTYLMGNTIHILRFTLIWPFGILKHFYLYRIVIIKNANEYLIIVFSCKAMVVYFGVNWGSQLFGVVQYLCVLIQILGKIQAFKTLVVNLMFSLDWYMDY